jgi:hypothetical protein
MLDHERREGDRISAGPALGWSLTPLSVVPLSLAIGLRDERRLAGWMPDAVRAVRRQTHLDV